MLRKLGLEQNKSIVFTGAGGKTTAVYRLVQEFLDEGIPAAAATTTKMWLPEQNFLEWTPDTDADWMAEALKSMVNSGNPAVITIGRRLAGGKIGAPSFSYMKKLMEKGIRLCIEADGAAGKWFKIPNETEPVIPKWTDAAVGILNIRAEGKSFLEAAHRPAECAGWFGKEASDRIEREDFIRAFLDEKGILKGARGRKRAILTGLEKGDRKKREDCEVICKTAGMEGLPVYIWE